MYFLFPDLTMPGCQGVGKILSGSSSFSRLERKFRKAGSKKGNVGNESVLSSAMPWWSNI